MFNAENQHHPHGFASFYETAVVTKQLKEEFSIPDYGCCCGSEFALLISSAREAMLMFVNRKEGEKVCAACDFAIY
jgi:hypothetical protein